MKTNAHLFTRCTVTKERTLWSQCGTKAAPYKRLTEAEAYQFLCAPNAANPDGIVFSICRTASPAKKVGPIEEMQMRNLRPAPSDCRQEPPYPGLETVLFSIRAPEMTGHQPTDRCSREEPHAITECGEWHSC